ncbi:MAG TPA: ABC transporter ATP-binding protein [Gemmatales bacterium]|nr:ABC transporter ATP-binding protein [Gemmatales bacterium]HMP16311.1 ABC transporter ATP-binding protein [Gemmatales bacterium]
MTDHLRAENLVKSYHKHRLKIPVLQGVNLAAAPGAFVSIVGTSGSGKSTLLHLLGTLDKPDSGAIYLHEKRIDNVPSAERDLLRNRTFGYIFQFYHLLPELTVLENVLMTGLIHHSILSWLGNRGQQRRAAQATLERVGLGHRLRHKPRELSGGEMQRAAIARALIASPQILLADEPTGNLDVDTGGEVLKLLMELNREEKLTIIMVTHNRDMAQQTGQVLHMQRGVLVKSPETGQPASSGIERLKISA